MSRFIIRSLDSYNEKSYEIVTGKKTETSETVEYEYLSKLGKCKISVLEDRVIIDRDNNGIATILDVDMKRETEFVYYGEGFKKEFVTLHVNEGTFAPVTNQNFLLKSLHKEYYNIDKLTAKRLNAAKKNNINIIAVGTTVTRTLESACSNKQLTKLSGETDIFIQESDTLQFTDMLITNFHLPKSSLMMLVSAFIGRPKLLEVYQLAIKNKFKFYSFGDAMLIV